MNKVYSPLVIMFLVLSSGFVSIKQTNVTLIPDTNFELALIELGYDDVLDGSVLTSAISALTSINLDSKNISDLSGIEDFISLTEFSCYNNQLTTIDLSHNIA